MKVFFLSVLLLFLYGSLSAQERHYSTTDKEAIKYYALANQNIDNHAYDEAIEQLLQAIEEDDKFIEAHLVLADVYRQKWKYKEAIDQYHKVLSLNPDFNKFVYFKLGDCDIHIAEYLDAEKNFENI